MELNNILNKAFKWVWDNIEFFDVLNECNRQSKKTEDIAIKMLGELCLTLMLLHKIKNQLSEDNRMYFNNMILFIQNILTKPLYYERIMVNPNHFWLYGLVICYFLKIKEDTLLRSVVEKTYKIAEKLAVEIVPYRQMDHLHTINLLSNIIPGIQKDEKRMDKYAKLSILYSDLNLTLIQFSEEYALTHSIFYYTEFGEKPIKLSKKRLEIIKKCVSVQALMSIIKDDCDLLAEYIMCFANLNMRNELSEFCLNYLISKQYEDGTFPNINRNDVSGEKYQEDYVVRNYHTVLVVVMALALYIKSDEK